MNTEAPEQKEAERWLPQTRKTLRACRYAQPLASCLPITQAASYPLAYAR